MDTQGAAAGGRVVGRVVGAVLLLLATALGGAVALLVVDATGEQQDAAAECDVRRTVGLAVPPELFGVVAEAVEEVAPACTRVETDIRPASQVALAVSTGATLPDVWIAESRFWMTRTYLGRAAGLRMVSPSVASTPVLLVGGPAASRFDSWGEAEVSGLVSVPDPLSSTVGSLAVVAPQAEATAVGRGEAAARGMVVPFAQAYGERVANGLDQGADLVAVGRRSKRLVVSTEQALTDARTYVPFLRDLTPPVGAPRLEFPIAIRQDAAPGSGAIARSLVRHLASEAGRAALAEAGLRPPLATTGPDAGAGPYLPPVPAPTIAGAVQSWRTLSVPSAMLAVVDVSGSMDYAGGGGTRMELLADAAAIGLTFLPDHARVGLWVFSIDKGGPGRDWLPLEPTRRLDDLRFGRTQRFALRARARALPTMTDGGTGLYDTALAAYMQALSDYRRGYSNTVVLMTDGKNEDPGSIELEELIRELRELQDPRRPVRIIGIAISKDADLSALQRMGDATGGDAYRAAEPEDILGVFAQALLSR